MEMPIAPASLSDQNLEHELRLLADKAAEVRKTLDDDMGKLDATRAERQRLLEDLARGTAKESEPQRIKAAIEEIEFTIEVDKWLLRANRSRTNQLGQELGRRQVMAGKSC
jgi:hypothetical protein